MEKRPCKYWVFIQKRKSGPRPYYHTLGYQIKWGGTGWSDPGSQYNKKNLVRKIGPFPTRIALLDFYWSNQANLPGGTDAQVLDYAERFDCDDQE
jgi:hypothetical protein